MTPLAYYQQQINSGLIEKDPQQYEVILELESIYHQLLKKDYLTKHFWGRWLESLSFSKNIKGLYIWGSVGVGKTFLMDIFYHCLPIKKKRSHFHQFMRDIHLQMKQLQGKENPLNLIAKQIAKKTHVLCFDEFIVEDIADAMILTNLFKALFDYRICLIASANVSPDDLYKNGLQREIFLPSIALIKKNTHVFHMISHHDYRLTHIHQAGVYFTPLGKQAELNMEKCFSRFSHHQPTTSNDIEILGRPIRIYKEAGDTIWFNFFSLCDIPRSKNDYLELAKKYKTVLISDIPIITAKQNNLITAFINLIDIFYDARIRVIISAAADVEELYPSGQLRFAFARTQSRLIEMQSADYFGAG